MELLRQAWLLFEPRERLRAVALLMMMMIGAGFEALGVGLVMPFIALLADPSSVTKMPVLAGLLEGSSEATILMWMGLGLLGVYVIKNGYLALMYYVQFRFVFHNQVRLSRRLFASYLERPYAFHLRRNSAELLRNVNEEVRMGFIHVIIPLLSVAVEVMVVAVIAALLFWVEPVAAPVALVFFATVSWLFYRLVRTRSAVLGRTQQEQASLMIQWVNQGLGGAKETRVLGRERYFIDAYTRSSETYASAMLFHRVVKELPRNVIETVGLGAMILVVVVIVARGEDIGQVLPVLALFAVAAVRLMPSLTRIIAGLTGIRHFRPCIDVIAADLELLDRHPVSRPEISEDAHEPIAFEDDIRFEHVQYRYPESEPVVLDDLSLTIERGQSVALVGASGAGKTTAVDVLLGLLEPERGRVLVDGRDIQDHLRSWQDKIGYIAQPVYLMDDTIRRNVAYGIEDEEIDDAKVWRALEDARIDDLVRALPGGLDEAIGEHGVRISGGQRQRIGIARALYHRPEVLVLDEATSALDNETEKEIVAALEGLRGDKTVIIIAHRLSTVRRCDRLFVLEQGRLIDEGTYDELMGRCPAFQNMVLATEPTRAVNQAPPDSHEASAQGVP
jgi:ATP-binding cassette, subfamily B, bacterial PglK